MGKNLIILFVFALLIGAMLACGFSGRNEPIQIRIQNETGLFVEDFWLGSSNRGRHHFSSIEPGEQTNYRGIGSHTSEYAQSSAYINGKTFAHVTIPVDQELDPRSYTFVLRLVNNQPTVTIRSD